MQVHVVSSTDKRVVRAKLFFAVLAVNIIFLLHVCLAFTKKTMSSSNTVVHVMKHIRHVHVQLQCVYMLVTNKAAIHVPLVMVVVSDM